MFIAFSAIKSQLNLNHFCLSRDINLRGPWFLGAQANYAFFLLSSTSFFFIIISGLGVMAVSLWLLFDQQLYLQNLGAQQTDYYVGTYIILAIGGIMTLVGK